MSIYTDGSPSAWEQWYFETNGQWPAPQAVTSAQTTNNPVMAPAPAASPAAAPAGPVSANPWGSFNGNFQGGLSQDLINWYQQQAASKTGPTYMDPTYGQSWGVMGDQKYFDDPTGRYRFTMQDAYSAPFTDEYGRQMVYDKNGNVHPYDPSYTQGYNLWDTQTQMGGAYDASGKYKGALNLKQEIDPMDLVGLAMIAAPMAAAIGGVGAGAAGGAAGATEGAAGAGITGFGDAGLMYGGADAAAAGSLGGGASVYGGSALGSIGAGTSAMGAGGGGLGGAGGAGGSGGGSLGSISNILSGNGSASDWLGLATTALGAYGGSQGQNQSTTSSRTMDPRLDGPVYGQLVPTAQGLLASTTPQAQMAGAQLMAKGSGLLGQTAPTTATNPYLSSIADDLQRRTADLLGQNNLAIQGNAVSSGGLGGSRQGVAQGLAASKAADSLQGQIAGLYGNAYEGDQNRLRQDWTLGSGMLSQGTALPFMPAQQTAGIYSPFTGFGTTTNTAQGGGGTMGALGGALGAAQWWQNMYGKNQSGTPPNPWA